MIVLSSVFGVRRFNARCISLLILLFFSANIFAQHTILLNEDASPQADYYFNNMAIHSTIKPALDVDLNGRTVSITDSVITVTSADFSSVHTYVSIDTLSYPRLTFRNYYKINKTYDDLITVDRQKAAFLIRPIYDLSAGYDFKSKLALFSTVGGAILDADYKQKIGIEIRFMGGNATLPSYLDSVATASGTMPGYGDRAYATKYVSSYTFQHISGNLIWRPSKIFNLQVGRDKHFWGDGYRSLFLSDVSAAMPYIKQTTTIWKLQYVSLFAWMQDNTSSNGWARNFRNKFGSFHFISFNALKWLNVGIFESIIWQGNDPNRQRGFDPNYLNPIIFFRPIEYSLGSSDNAMLGMSLKFRLNKNNLIYSQLLLDEFYLKEILARKGWWANKQGYQIGMKCFNFGKVKNLFLQTELNIVRPFTYSHGSKQQNYSNAGNPLAHPLGANFMEWLGIISYSHNNYIFSGKIFSSLYGLDLPDGANYGQDINRSYLTRDHEYSNYLLQGVRTNLFYGEFSATYKFNTKFPLNVQFTAGVRHEHNVYDIKNDAYVRLGLSLPLWRTYCDY